MFDLETFLEKAALELGLVQQTHEGRAVEDGFEGHPAFPVGRVELSGPSICFKSISRLFPSPVGGCLHTATK